MTVVVDGDSHFMEPLDLYERYIDPPLRDRTVRMGLDPAAGKRVLLVDNKPMKLRDVEEVLGLLTAYGQKEAGRTLSNFDRYIAYSAEWQDMDARVHFMDAEGIAVQVIYPSIGIIWEGEVDDPVLADALCRAYNRWAFELVAGHRGRLFPAAHISMRDPALAIKEMQRVAAPRCAHGLRRCDANQRKELRTSGFRSDLGRRRRIGPCGRTTSGVASPLHRQRLLSRPQARADVLLDESDPGPASGFDHDGGRRRVRTVPKAPRRDC